MRKNGRISIFSVNFLLLTTVLLIPGMVNEGVFGSIKPLMLGDLSGLIEGENYSKAYELASDYLDKQDDPEIARLKSAAEEKQLYRYTLKIPARDIEINQRLYEILKSMNPDEELYRRKHAHYHSLVMEKGRQRDTVMPARLADFSGPGEKARPKDLKVLIENRKIRLGMTMEEVRISWGEPADTRLQKGVSAPYTQWNYPGWRYVFFENGRCTAFNRGLKNPAFN